MVVLSDWEGVIEDSE